MCGWKASESGINTRLFDGIVQTSSNALPHKCYLISAPGGRKQLSPYIFIMHQGQMNVLIYSQHPLPTTKTLDHTKIKWRSERLLRKRAWAWTQAFWGQRLCCFPCMTQLSKETIIPSDLCGLCVELVGKKFTEMGLNLPRKYMQNSAGKRLMEEGKQGRTSP